MPGKAPAMWQVVLVELQEPVCLRGSSELLSPCRTAILGVSMGGYKSTSQGRRETVFVGRLVPNLPSCGAASLVCSKICFTPGHSRAGGSVTLSHAEMTERSGARGTRSRQEALSDARRELGYARRLLAESSDICKRLLVQDSSAPPQGRK